MRDPTYKEALSSLADLLAQNTQLRAELEAVQRAHREDHLFAQQLLRENARLAAALVAAREVLRNLHGWLPKTSEELWPMIEPVQGQIASALYGNSTAFHELLLPAQQLLVDLRPSYVGLGGELMLARIDAELTRLREVCRKEARSENG